MPKYTNRFGYPEAIVRAVINDTYSKGNSDYSVTELIGPARIRILEKKHDHEIEIDVDDRIFILQGQAMHSILERAGNTLSNSIVEKRFFAKFDGVIISGQLDYLSLDTETLIDWKNSSVYSVKKDSSPKQEWVAQANCLLELLRQNSLDAKKLQIWVVCRDWRPGESKKDKRYPNKLGFHDIPIAPRERTQAYISRRIKEHKEAEITLPECSKEEHWEWRRCEGGYCSVAKFCSQYQQHKEHA